MLIFCELCPFPHSLPVGELCPHLLYKGPLGLVMYDTVECRLCLAAHTIIAATTALQRTTNNSSHFSSCVASSSWRPPSLGGRTHSKSLFPPRPCRQLSLAVAAKRELLGYYIQTFLPQRSYPEQVQQYPRLPFTPESEVYLLPSLLGTLASVVARDHGYEHTGRRLLAGGRGWRQEHGERRVDC